MTFCFYAINQQIGDQYKLIIAYLIGETCTNYPEKKNAIFGFVIVIVINIGILFSSEMI